MCLNIPYVYYELVDIKDLNELYNCLDLYIVSSRVEGGPRSIMECALTKTAIISTDVGIASLILYEKNIYDVNNYLSYKDAKYYKSYAVKNTQKYIMKNYMGSFTHDIFNLNT